tara:strand:+ start:477 stop:1496 length:1020 start_codon:yes stop_codon:yes gene_type:complete
MKLREGYIEDLRLRSVAEVVVDPKNKLAKVASKFLQGVRNKDLIDPKPPYDPKSKEDKKRLRIEWVRVSLLKISLDYQRYICASTIKKASQFDYLLCQPLVICQRPDGTLVIVDGQHKAIMAFLSGKDLDVPCQIYIHKEGTSLKDCIAFEAEWFSKLNTSRKNTSKLDKVRAGLSCGDEESIKFEENFKHIGIQAEGIGHQKGPEVNGFAKVEESISKWKRDYTKYAVEHLKPIYNDTWKIDQIDGSMIGGLAAIFSLINALGNGSKALGLQIYLDDNLKKVARSVWTANTRGASDVLIARKIVLKYNDLVDQDVIENGCKIGEDFLSNNRLADPSKL